MKNGRRQSMAGALALLLSLAAACRSSGCKRLDDLVGVQPEEDGEAGEASEAVS